MSVSLASQRSGTKSTSLPWPTPAIWGPLVIGFALPGHPVHPPWPRPPPKVARHPPSDLPQAGPPWARDVLCPLRTASASAGVGTEAPTERPSAPSSGRLGGRGTWESGAPSLRVPPRPPCACAAPGPRPRPRLEPRTLVSSAAKGPAAADWAAPSAALSGAGPPPHPYPTPVRKGRPIPHTG